jgi:transcriptional regulator with XRE-family HTH domain
MDNLTANSGLIASRVDDYVGERIRMRRTELGLTQDELARRLGISYQQVQKYETGANRISAGRLYEIAQELSVEVSYLFEGFQSERNAGQMPHGGNNRAAIDLVRNFQEIKDDTLRSAVAGLLKAMKETQNAA